MEFSKSLIFSLGFCDFTIHVVQGKPYWIVNEKVSGYGDRLTLFCLVDDCCFKAARWTKYAPYFTAIYLDVRVSKNITSTKDKYAATTNSTGFSLVIKMLQKEDLNINYSCSYGFEHSQEKFLLQSDVFKVDETTKTNFEDEMKTVLTSHGYSKESNEYSELLVAGIIIGSLVVFIVILVLAVVLILKRKRNNRKKHFSQQVAESSKKDQCVRLLKISKERKELVYGTADFVNIVIMHTAHDPQGVESFKSHLKHLSKEMGFNDISIKLFEEVFQLEQFSSVSEIETVLQNCNYVFVYISKNFYLNTLTPRDKNEYLIQYALGLQETNTNIKIICNCGNWDFPSYEVLGVEPDSVFLDFFKYKCHSADDIMNDEYKRKFKNLLRECTEIFDIGP